MKKNDRYMALLLAIFVVTAVVRIYISFLSPNMEYEAYSAYRQVESITNKLVPEYADELSHSGRFMITQPVYYYSIAPFAYLLGTETALKIVPNIFASLLVIVTYLIVFEITRNRNTALFSGFAAGFIPVFFSGTINSASSYSLTIPLMMYLVYCMMKNKEKNYLYQFIGFSFVLSLTSSAAFLLVLGLLIYLVLTKLEYKTESKREIELILFVTFLVIWLNILIYKDAFLAHGPSLIWQNLPSQILNSYFKEINVFEAVTSIGLLPLLFGIFAVHKHMLKEKDRRTYLLMAFSVAVTFALWFKLISFNIGMMFLGAILVPLFGQSVFSLFAYIDKTKISRLKPFFAVLLTALFIATSVTASLMGGLNSINKSVSQEEIEALEYLKNNTDPDAVVLSTMKEGHLIAAIAERKNVADSNFILIRNPDEKYDDIKNIYTAILKTSAVETLNKYNVNHVYFSRVAQKEFGIEELKFAELDCFEPIYDKGVKIYEAKCMIRSAE